MSRAAAILALVSVFALGAMSANRLATSAPAAKRPCPGNSCHVTTTESTATTTPTSPTTPTAPTTPTTTTTSPTTPTTAPSSIYWGAYIDGNDTYAYHYGGTWGDAPWDANTWSRFTRNAGKAPSIVHWGVGTPWAHDFSYWRSPFDAVQAAGALSLVDMNTGNVALRDIANGAYDSTLRTWARGAKAWSHPFFLRVNWEMNGGWFSWGTTSKNVNTPSDYVAAWRRMHDIFRSEGSANVTWVWCPNLEFAGSVAYSTLYPGDSYVDWTCLDGYNRGTSSSTFASLFTQSYKDLLAVAPRKPVMIGEVGSLEYGSAGKAAWVTDALEKQLPASFPQVKAVVWFNWRINESGKWWNWEIESSASAQTAFAQAVATPYYAAARSFPMPAPLAPIAPR